MNANAIFFRPLFGAVLCIVASTAAQAVPVSPISYSSSSLAGYAPTLFNAYTTTGNAGTVSTSVTNQYLTPAGVAATAAYVYTSPTDGAIHVTPINASSFSFLWGSPDAGNIVTYQTSLGDFSYTGSDLAANFGISINGNPDVSTVFTASLANGVINSATFTSQNIAFEVDGVRKVPEPGGIALVSAALGALAWTGRRRKA